MTEGMWSRKSLLIVVSAVAMGAAGSYQFIWSSIRPALAADLAMSNRTLGTVFTLYVACQTLSQFPAGWVRDRFGPRPPLAVGSVCITAGYLGIGYASDTSHVFLAYAVGGIGAGIAFTVAVNTPVKWFDEYRGLATGFVTMAYGGVSVLFIPYVRSGVTDAFTGTLTALAVISGMAALLGVFVLHDPSQSSEASREANDDIGDAHGWRQAIRTWQFWVLYLVFVVVNAVGLMIIGKAVSYAQQFGLAAAVVTVTASVVAIADSIGIVTIGALSDRFDRANTVAVTLILSGIATGLSVWAGQTGRGLVFVALVGLACFFRSPAFSIIPVLVGEYYGTARSSENYAALYTAKVWGGVGGGVAASALIATIGWSSAFLIGAVAMSSVGVVAMGLRPVERTIE